MSDDPRVSDEALARILTEVVAPMIEADNGGIDFVSRRGAVVELVLSGACRGCPGQHYTVKFVVLAALQAADPSVREIKVLSRRPGQTVPRG